MMNEIKIVAVNHSRELPEGLTMETLSVFFHETMKPYHDTIEDVHRGLEYAFDSKRGGFLVLATKNERPVGGLVMLDTHMGGYVPKNLLLFIAVDPAMRGQGLGRRLIEQAASLCNGPIKLHVEPDNPAVRLYQRAGFETRYLEMRWNRS